MTSRKKWGGGGRCQALECGRARYLPSLIALLLMGYQLGVSESACCQLLYPMCISMGTSITLIVIHLLHAMIYKYIVLSYLQKSKCDCIYAIV